MKIKGLFPESYSNGSMFDVRQNKIEVLAGIALGILSGNIDVKKDLELSNGSFEIKAQDLELLLSKLGAVISPGPEHYYSISIVDKEDIVLK